MKVAIVGATGETGQSIVRGLLESETRSTITALIRPISIDKPAVHSLRKQGIEVVSADLQGPQDELVKILKGIDVVISTLHYQSLADEIPLSNASKAAGVKRYVPCFFATVGPRGVMHLRDKKEEILDHINRIRLPYTVIDVGWWYQITLPRIPSGRFDYALVAPNNTILGGGHIPSALTDVRDVGVYVAQIINDSQTLNKKVFSFTEARTQNQIFELVERLSGENIQKTELSADDLESKVRGFEKSGTVNQTRAQYEYWNSWGIRGDNTPENARYLGYLLLDDLYPGLRGRSLESYVQELLEGKGERVYSG